MFGILKKLLGPGGPTLSPEDLARGTVVDVRTPGEFRGGHVPGSINIPLQSLDQQHKKLSKLKAPIILCCASGNRSGMAHRRLQGTGIETINGGSWQNVKAQLPA